ncbi:mandelate racemase/muconate lactonizing enzyme family protein [Litorilinea aerophila]|uniref:Mandelate racemase/muconate lactonizing enzyme family protein n=1 Tax=Litorilinea aerophila TaxID=1204385 RepID=A0A540VBU8_9CHLR|nr:mandelate racemase/muconate lactonizing enzyme family protein [Litorilinea aerophila]MCC9077990.1 mandelate racemase/muconate lactonizing enzyme family protein [Litorilinea aerophila]
MKITRIESLTFERLPRLLLVRVHTDAGLIGLGETYDKVPGAQGALHGTLAPILLGNDPRDIERLWHFCFDNILYHGYAGAELRALSAVEMALWDILGKSLNAPVYKLLGGAVRPSVSTYNTCIGHPPVDDYSRWHQDAGELARELAAEGITGVKIWPFDRFSVESFGQSIRPEQIEAGLEPVRQIRQAMGTDFRIGIECHFRWNRAAMEQICYALEPYNIYFVEDPLRAVTPAEIKRLSQATRIPIVGSETLLSRFQIRDWIVEGATQVVMTDLAWTGGIAETKRIAALAEAFGIPLVLHNAGGPITHMASLHVAANIRNLFELETVRAFYRTYFQELTDVQVQVQNGHVPLPPDRPGLGVELLPQVWERDDLRVAVSEGEGRAVGIREMGDSWSRPDIRL